MYLLAFSLFHVAVIAIAKPIVERAVAAPTVTIKNGTVIGSTANFLFNKSSVDSFLGIPYADPPTGNNRLFKPSPLATTFGTLVATATPLACPQMKAAFNSTLLTTLATIFPFLQQPATSGEDCLTLNVQRPSGISPSTPLPVVAWIYGGGFEDGSTQKYYDGTTLIQQSVAAGGPVIFVAMNYRLNGFGFLGGAEVKAGKASNLGLRDQRLALQWIQANIGAFGGDPTKVTIWGESAGSMSVYAHTIINGGDNTFNGKPLFRAAIMNSGSYVASLPIDSVKAQHIFDLVVAASPTCSPATVVNKLQCLRKISYAEFQTAVTSVPAIGGYNGINLSYLPRPDNTDGFFATSGDVALSAGAYAKVPVIITDLEDEGTMFSDGQKNITNSQLLLDYFVNMFPAATVAQINATISTYPDIPDDGSPFGTVGYNLYPEYKRMSAIIGDIAFTLRRRKYLQTISSKVNAWSGLGTWYSETLTEFPYLGTFHAADMLAVWLNSQPVGLSNIQQGLLQYYIGFFNSMNPNAYAQPQQNLWPVWPQYTTSASNLIQIGSGKTTIIPDDFRAANYAALVTYDKFLAI